MGCGASSAKNVEEQQKPVESTEKSIQVAKKQKEEDHAPPPPTHNESTGSHKVEKPHPKEERQEGGHEEKEHAIPPKKVKQKEEEHKPVIPNESPEPPKLKDPEEEENFENVEYGDDEHKAASVIQKKYKEHAAKKKTVSRMLICYTCGQKFGPTSLPIHLNDCPEQRLNDYKANLPKGLVPKSLPSPPSAPIPDSENGTQQEVDTYNEEAQELFSKYSLVHCPICDRGFECDRLTKHLTTCKDKDGHTWEEQQAAKTIQKNWNKHLTKKMLFCYCCGQEYGTRSLPIHIPECIEKRKSYWAHSGLPEDLLKDVPEPPVLPIPGSDDTAESYKSYNTEARTIYIASMAQCPNCNRKFEPDRLVVHLHSCKVHKTEE
ncbi:predicted protein [Naegleria gruberi]|uniref:Predicted protein n=1 Tax=Naegleria gruberi TaxID=5762 RepID=D2VLG1_NAEGR|nr:uncharacterized protein NAEGRDRAFT_50528 [Naegleria gruberi]EFC42380.1 predicted protein [Naegleria gruberi]|eukprot:XP_002675124.1 predicted protein [Naegleria gruberi strain NEG-M]